MRPSTANLDATQVVLAAGVPRAGSAQAAGWAGAEPPGGSARRSTPTTRGREAALSRARATEAELEAERRREEAAAARAAFDELAVLKHQEITELRADYFAEKLFAAARGAALEATAAELKNTRVVPEDTRKEAAAARARGGGGRRGAGRREGGVRAACASRCATLRETANISRSVPTR